MATVVVTTRGFDVAIAVLNRLDQGMLSKLTRAVGFKIEEQTVNHFRQQAGPHGPWEPTQRGGAILVKTGRLRGSIGSAQMSATEIAIGTNVHYGKYHQYGTSKMPRRAFLGLTQSDEGEIRNLVQNYIQRVIGGGA